MPFVHLIPPPLSLALDARLTGSEARFARSGCKPNAVLRPFLCRRGNKGKGKEKTATEQQQQRRTQTPEGEYDPTMPPPRFPASSTNGINGVSTSNGGGGKSPSPSASPTSNRSSSTSSSDANDNEAGEGEDRVSFAIFALRDLKAREEVVLGWEWDDGSVVHELPALVEALAFAGAETGGGLDKGQAAAGPSKMTCVPSLFPSIYSTYRLSSLSFLYFDGQSSPP